MKKNIIIIIIVLILGIGIGAVYYLNKDKNKSFDGRYIELKGGEFKEKIEAKESFILLIKRDGCKACMTFEPIYKTVVEEYGITAYSLNTTTLSEQEFEYLNEIANCEYTPTVVFIVNGQEETTVNRLVGSQSKRNLLKRLQSLGYIEE